MIDERGKMDFFFPLFENKSLCFHDLDDDFALSMAVNDVANRICGFSERITAVNDGSDGAVFEESAEMGDVFLVWFRDAHVHQRLTLFL